MPCHPRCTMTSIFSCNDINVYAEKFFNVATPKGCSFSGRLTSIFSDFTLVQML